MNIILCKLMTILVLATAISSNVYAHDNDKNSAKVVADNLSLKKSVGELEVGKIIAQFHQALKVGNPKKALALLAENVMIFEGGRVERSADDYAEHHMLADMKYLANIDSVILEQQIKIIGDLAYSMVRSKSTGQYQGRDIDSEGMETMVLLKEKGQWKIVHIHWSH
jgi:ketosteroid isomerase-like protein